MCVLAACSFTYASWNIIHMQICRRGLVHVTWHNMTRDALTRYFVRLRTSQQLHWFIWCNWPEVHGKARITQWTSACRNVFFYTKCVYSAAAVDWITSRIHRFYSAPSKKKNRKSVQFHFTAMDGLLTIIAAWCVQRVRKLWNNAVPKLIEIGQRNVLR